MKKIFMDHFLIVFLILSLSGSVLAGVPNRPECADSIEKSFDTGMVFEPSGSMEDYISFALQSNPGLKAAFYKWKSELNRAKEVSSLPDPIFSYGYFIENVETRVGPQNQKFSLKQTFPWFGILGTRKEMASETARGVFQKFVAERLEVIFLVKTAYIDYFLLGREIEITKAEKELLRSWESIVRSRYSASEAGYRDIIRAQVELAGLEEKLATLNRKRDPGKARLESALNIPEQEGLPFPGNIDDTGDTIDAMNVIDLVIDNNPDIRSIEHLLKKSQAVRRLEGKRQFPNFTLGLDYIETGDAANPLMEESGKDPWAVSVMINLPIWYGKNKSRKQKAAATVEMNRNRIKNTENMLKARTEAIVFEYNDATRKIGFYRNGLIPKTEQLLAATYAAYLSGKADFNELIDTRKELLKLRFDLERARVKKIRKLAEIEMLAGGRFWP